MKFPKEEALRKLTADTLRLEFTRYLGTDDFKHLLVEHGLGREWSRLMSGAEITSVLGDHLGTEVEAVTLLIQQANEEPTWKQFFISALGRVMQSRRGSVDVQPFLESMKKLGWSPALREQIAAAVAQSQSAQTVHAVAAESPRERRNSMPSSDTKKKSPAVRKSRLFIGSSREALPIAHAIHSNLQREFECTVWPHGVFGLSESNIEALESKARNTDFAVIVVSPDDKTVSRGKSASTPRDNVVFELGLFMGALGRDRTFAVQPQRSTLKVPSDLFGITFAEYEEGRSDGNWEAALGPACMKIREAARRAESKAK